MYVLGISGLDRSLGFKERIVPGLDWREQRYRQGLDSAAAIVSVGFDVPIVGKLPDPRR